MFLGPLAAQVFPWRALAVLTVFLVVWWWGNHGETTGGVFAVKALKDAEIVGTFPTSVTQKRCWFMEQIHPGNKGLNIAVRWELRGPVTGDEVEAAFQQIVDRHESLRTQFTERDGEPVQEVVASVDFRISRVDLRGIPPEDRDERIRRIAIEHAEEPFDLGKPCLLRVAMIKIEPERAGLLIAVHNSVFDGYSIGVLGHELGTILQARAEGKAPDLPELALQYGDFAMWLTDYEASGAMDEEKQYWIKTLEGMRYFELPSDRPRIAAEPDNRSYAVDLPPDFETRLAEAARTLETSVFTLGTAAFSIALERFSGRSDVSFAVQVAGRNEVDLEPLIGIFTNPIVLRFDVRAGGSLNDHVRAARDVVNGALAHQTLPFDKLVQTLNPPRDPLRIPLVSVMFNLQRAFLKERRYGPVELVSVQSHSPGTLYDLNVNIVGRNSGWRMVMDYSARLFDQPTIERLSDLMLEVVDTLIHRPETGIAELAPAALAVSDAPGLHAGAPAEPGESAAMNADQGTTDTGATERPAPLLLESGNASDTKSRLAAIWSDVLALPADRVDANFFDLGGYSALALRMLARVSEQFSYRPSLHAFLADPSLGGLASLLDARSTAQATATPEVQAASGQPASPAPVGQSEIWELAELRPGSDTAPVLLTVNQPFMYQSLARELGSDCVVANIGINDTAQLAALARSGFDAAIGDAVGMVRARYGGRALMLCGLCVDGRVALGLAQGLQAKGDKITSLAMIDSWAPGAIRAFSGLARWRDRWRIRLRRLRYYLSLRRRGEIMTLDLLRQNDLVARVLSALRLAPRKGEVETLVDDVVDEFVSQTREYAFDPYDGEVLLFVTRSQGMVPRDGVLGWSKLFSPDVSVYPVNGWHGDALMRSGFERISGVLDAKARRLAKREPDGDEGHAG